MEAIDALANKFDGTDDDFFQAAAEAFTALAIEGGRQALMSTLIARLQGGEGEIRRCAARAFGGVAEKGSQEAVSALIAAMQDTDVQVRRVAATSLGAVADHGDQEVRLLQGFCFMQGR